MVEQEAAEYRPDRVANEDGPAITAIACCLSSSRNITGITEIAIGKIAAAPTPSSARAAMSSPTLTA